MLFWDRNFDTDNNDDAETDGFVLANAAHLAGPILNMFYRRPVVMGSLIATAALTGLALVTSEDPVGDIVRNNILVRR